jgi:hypothetical protein
MLKSQGVDIKGNLLEIVIATFQAMIARAL